LDRERSEPAPRTSWTKPEGFARRLKIHKRTALRWRDGETDPAPGLWENLDKLLIETARKLAPWLHLDQLSTMHRRDILTILAASIDIPLAGIDLLWNGILTEVSNASLSSLEEITMALAGKYDTTPPHMLLAPVLGHLEKATALMGGTMRPSQRWRLESIVADAAIFAGVLSRASGKLAKPMLIWDLPRIWQTNPATWHCSLKRMPNKGCLTITHKRPIRMNSSVAFKTGSSASSERMSWRAVTPLLSFRWPSGAGWQRTKQQQKISTALTKRLSEHSQLLKRLISKGQPEPGTVQATVITTDGTKATSHGFKDRSS
jgi:hypothetical protein